MRVKEKPYPLNHGVDVASVVSSNKSSSKITTVIEVESPNQVLDLSRQSEKANGYSGTTETDAIHRRLGSLDGDVHSFEKSVVDLMESSSAGGKRKRSPIKVSPEKNVKESGASEPSPSVTQSAVDNVCVKNELFKDVSPKEQETKTTPHIPATSKAETKGKKKSVAQGKKSSKKKKNVKKKSFAKDEDEFEIDPRLGGTKIKQSISNKGKDKKLKTTDQEKRNKLVEQRFPYVHIEGTWNSPNIVKIVNGHAKEDENEGKSATKLTKAAQYIDEEHRNKAAKVGFTSTLSDRYDTHNRDVSWVCVFCQLFTHTQCLGDLYGPYYITQVPAESIWFSKRNPDTRINQSGCLVTTGSEPTSPVRTCPKKSKKSPKKKSLLKDEIPVRPVTPTAEDLSIGTQRIGSDNAPVGIFPLDQTNEKIEVWFHESCVIWAPGVCLVPPRLVGLDEAVSDSQQVICEYCKKRGGHIFCRSRGCGLRTHYPCAVTSGWLLREETFMALCPSHLEQAAVT